MREAGGGAINNTIWAADVDDVECGAVVGHTMIGMMHVFNAMMENTSLGAMSGMGSAIAIMEKMEDYNPILTIDDRGETRLISTDGPGNADFYPGCQLM